MRTINFIGYFTSSSNLSTVAFHSSENGCLQLVYVRALISYLRIHEGITEADGGSRILQQ